MKVPYFRAKDKDSDAWIEGFYVQFPLMSDAEDSSIMHVLLAVAIDENSLSEDMINENGEIFNGLIGIARNFTMGNKNENYRLVRLNKLIYVTIDIDTLEQIGEIEIGNTNWILNK